MHIWIDLDNHKHVPLVKAFSNELRGRGHTVTVTALNTNEIKNALKEHSFEAKVIGKIFSFFGLFEQSLYEVRIARIFDYLQFQGKLDAFFSLGSKTMLYSCLHYYFPIIFLLDAYKDKYNTWYPCLKRYCFIFPENTPDQIIIQQGYDIKSIVKYKGFIDKEGFNHSLISVKDIISLIESQSKHVPGGINA